MSFIKTIPAEQASKKLHEMYQRQQDHWGYIPNYAKTFSHRPEVMSRWGKLLAEIRRPVDDRRFELVTFVTALELKHTPCSLGHGNELAKIIGVENVIALANGEEPEALTRAEIAMLKFARAIARDARGISDEEVSELKETHGFSDEEIFDIAAIAAGRCFFTKVLDALGSEADVSFMSLDAKLRDPLTVGRPIAKISSDLVSDGSTKTFT